MLHSLAIRDVVLIERLVLTFEDGLSALTGETGAGKSILLDSLGLALGARAERGLVRQGAEQAMVTAIFQPPDTHPVWAFLVEQGIEPEAEIVLRRSLRSDERGRAFINDQPVGTALLRRVGELLVEVHGQFDQRGLVAPARQRDLLDAFGGHALERVEVGTSHGTLVEARASVASLLAGLETARREEEYLRHREQELADLAPEPGEDEGLAEQRTRLQHRDKLIEVVREALAAVSGHKGAVDSLAAAQRKLERVGGMAAGALDPAIGGIDRALVELAEAGDALGAIARDLDAEGGDAERIEERLFALRDAARKHRCSVDDLPALLESTRRELAVIDQGGEALALAQRVEREAHAAFLAAVAVLSERREAAASELATAVMRELPPLKLERARFRVLLDALAPAAFGADGGERVLFEVATNPGQPFTAIGQTASGGELSRLMLALKVVLARLDDAPTLVFDEIDAGLGGATAAAVGDRLARLAAERQVLVVTHAPQVAARANAQYSVEKRVDAGKTMVEVRRLDQGERRDEVARMLAGAEVTEAARAAADSLIQAVPQA